MPVITPRRTVSSISGHFATMNSSCLLLLIVLFISCNISVHGKNDGMLDKIKKGLQYASNYLETARDIADLVSKSLGHKEKEKHGDVGDEKQRQMFTTPNLVSAFFRLLGLDSQKIAAITVNSVIFLAQMISSLFELAPPEIQASGRSAQDDEPPWDPMKFVMENKNERIQSLVTQAQDENLPTRLIDKMDGYESSCIRLLLCKTSPVIRAAQNSLKNKTRTGRQHITWWLPSREEFEANSDECEMEHTDCSLFPES